MPFRRRPEGERGAAAVEFALLFPIFVMLTFGTITAGVGYWRYIEVTQSARDSSRYGTTLPIDPAGSTTCASAPATGSTMGIGCWLKSVSNLAAASAGWPAPSTLTTPLDVSDGDGYICVAYVSGGVGSISDSTLVTGSARTGDAVTGSAPCFTDGLSGPRVQTVIRRDNPFNAVFLGRTWEMRTRSVLPYERNTS